MTIIYEMDEVMSSGDIPKFPLDLSTAFPRGPQQLLDFVVSLQKLHRDVTSGVNPYVDDFYLTASPDELHSRLVRAGLSEIIENTNALPTADLCARANPVLQQVGTTLETLYAQMRDIARYVAKQGWDEMQSPNKEERAIGYGDFHLAREALEIPPDSGEQINTLIGRPVRGQINVHDEFIECDVKCSHDYLHFAIRDIGMASVIGRRSTLSDSDREDIIHLVEAIAKWSQLPTDTIYQHVNERYNFGASSIDFWKGSADSKPKDP